MQYASLLGLLPLVFLVLHFDFPLWAVGVSVLVYAPLAYYLLKKPTFKFLCSVCDGLYFSKSIKNTEVLNCNSCGAAVGATQKGEGGLKL